MAALAESAATAPAESVALRMSTAATEPAHQIRYKEIEGAAPVERAEAVAVAEAGGSTSDGLPESESVNVWPDDASEAAFLSDARDRGEPVKAAPQVIEEVEDREAAKALPKVSELEARIPAEARELLEDLFRAKFVAVRRVRKTDLKE